MSMLCSGETKKLISLQRIANLANFVAYLNTGRDEERRVQMEICGTVIHPQPRRLHVGKCGENGKYTLAWVARIMRFLRSCQRKMPEGVVLLMGDKLDVIEKDFEKVEPFPDDWKIVFLGGLHLEAPDNVAAFRQLVTPNKLYAVGAALINLKQFDSMRVEIRTLLRETTASAWPLDTVCKCTGILCFLPNLMWSNHLHSPLPVKEYATDIFTHEGSQNVAPQIEQLAFFRKLTGEQTRSLLAYRQPRASVRCRPKLALLFLTRSGSLHDKMWDEFQRCMPGYSTSVVYARHPWELTEGFSKKNLSKLRALTDWGHLSLVRVSLGLLRLALENTEATHFVFLSEKCVPIVPLEYIISSLEADHRSRIAILDCNPHGRSPSSLILCKSLLIHPQWLLLSRLHAELVANHDFTEDFLDSFAPDESYFGTVLNALGVDMRSDINRINVTFKEFPGWNKPHPREWNNVNEMLLREMRSSGAFFARKFAATSNIRSLKPHISSGIVKS